MTDNDWHLDKRVPITLIVVLLVQTAGIVWFASAMNSKIEQNEARVTRLEILDSSKREIIQNNTTSIAVINENLKYIGASLSRIEAAIEKQDERNP